MANSEDIKKMAKLVDAKLFDFEKVSKETGITQGDVDTLRKMASSAKIIAKATNDRFFLIVLSTCDNNKEKSLKLAENFCKLFRKLPQFCENLSVENIDVKGCLDRQIYLQLPSTPDNCSLLFHKLTPNEPKKYNFDASVKTLGMTHMLQCFVYGPGKGLVVVFDMDGCCLQHVFQASPRSIQNALKFINDGLVQKLRAVHVLNVPSFMDVIIALVKPFLKAEIFKLIQFHKKDLDYNKFYKECVPKSCLPSNYGGDLESVEVLNKKNRAKLEEFEDFFTIFEKMMNFELDDIELGIK